MNNVRFDDSLPTLVTVVSDALGPTELCAGTVLRDATGALAFFAATPLSDDRLESLAADLRKSLGAYARSDRAVVGVDGLGAEGVRNDPTVLLVKVLGLLVRLVDRRVVGADWLRVPPVESASRPSRIVFASLKGGVGRTTALSVAAAHLASRGLRVLAVDLDMEAPGLGALVLTQETLPEFGMIDALVEDGMSGLDDAFLADLIGSATLTNSAGRIDIIPALGKRSLDNPGDVLAKLARAYAEDVSEDGTVATILDQVRAVLDAVTSSGNYDVVLADARAGLHETTASAILGLGAEVFLFGLNEDQTFQGYRVMLSHLARLTDPRAPIPEWVERLTMVEGKLPEGDEDVESFEDRCQQLFRDAGFVEGGEVAPLDVEPVLEGDFNNVEWDDEVADAIVLREQWTISEPVTILFDPRFHRFNPRRRPSLLTRADYLPAFGALLDRIDRIVDSAEESS